MTRTRFLLAPAALAAALAACAPAADTSPATPTGAPVTTEDGSALAELERTAWEAWHLMQLGFLRNGAYSTNVLVDLPLPQGVRWTVASFDDDGYALTFTAEDAADAYRVDPSGVRPAG